MRVSERLEQRRYVFRMVFEIGVDHHHAGGTGGGAVENGLSIAEVAIMADDAHIGVRRQLLERAIRRTVVDEDQRGARADGMQPIYELIDRCRFVPDRDHDVDGRHREVRSRGEQARRPPQ